MPFSANSSVAFEDVACWTKTIILDLKNSLLLEPSNGKICNRSFGHAVLGSCFLSMQIISYYSSSVNIAA